MASKVYWADLRADFHENLQQKLTRLMKTAGMGEIDFDRKFVAIKMHFGEPGNLAFLRPNWAKTVADFVKERGGKPFLTDCNTLYVGGRKNGLDHLDTACLNGFNPMTTGCQVIIADGIKGSSASALPARSSAVPRSFLPMSRLETSTPAQASRCCTVCWKCPKTAVSRSLWSPTSRT